MARRRLVLGIAASLAMVLSAAAGWWLDRSGRAELAIDASMQKALAMTAAAGLTVGDVLVEGRAQVSAERILDILDIEHGMPILAIDPEGVRRRLVELGWIATAEVTRRLPNTIYVRITERQPAAIWQQGGQLALIDPGGTVITREGLEAFADLPHVVGLGAEAQVRALLAALEGFPELGEDIAAAVWVSQRRWDLVLTGGTKVRLPEGDISTALSHLIEMKRDYAVMEKNVVSIDLRIEDRLIVRLPGDEGAAVGPESDPVITIPQMRPNSPQDMPGDSRRQDT